jgi:ketosteroid isomerase-like protein
MRETERVSENGADLMGGDDLPPDAVEQIRASNDAWHRRDIGATLAPYADEIEWDTTAAFPDGHVYRGMPAFRAYADEVLERWGRAEHRLEIDEIFEAVGRPTVVVHYRMLGRSQSGVPVDARWVHVFDFRAGKIVRARNFTSLDVAVESLGATRLARIWNAPPAEQLP